MALALFFDARGGQGLDNIGVPRWIYGSITVSPPLIDTGSYASDVDSICRTTSILKLAVARAKYG